MLLVNIDFAPIIFRGGGGEAGPRPLAAALMYWKLFLS